MAQVTKQSGILYWCFLLEDGKQCNKPRLALESGRNTSCWFVVISFERILINKIGGLVAIAVSKMYNRATRKRDEQNDQEVQRVEPSSRRGSTITLSSTSASGGQQSQKQQNNTQQTLIIIQPEAIYRRKVVTQKLALMTFNFY